jgi:hypothetical protein
MGALDRVVKGPRLDITSWEGEAEGAEGRWALEEEGMG